MKKIISIIFVVSILISGCGQYEDGPDLSLRSKKERISGLWQPSEIYDYQTGQLATQEQEEYFNDVSYGFYKDGNGIYFKNGWQYYFTWMLSEDKEQIIINYQDGYPENWNILRLTNDELWIYMENNPDLDYTPEIHFIKIED